ncbi:hypothetical protein L7F22_005934 [Adiantum nelumboides]|nr:hypothetical protein [Adiantum nelumboides]
MKDQCQEDIEEDSTPSESEEELTTTASKEEEDSDLTIKEDSSIEIMGIRLKPLDENQYVQVVEEVQTQEQPQGHEEMIEGMLSKTLTQEVKVGGTSVARITAADVSKFVLDYFCSRFGTPLEILSDRGPGFKADLLDALLENLSIKHVHSTPYYPQCNGLVEKTNGVLCKIITKHVRDRPQDWDKHLTAALWAYRKVSTQFTPYHLVYGQEALLPIEVDLGNLRVLAKDATSSKEKLEQRILDLQRLELDKEAATDYYIAQANKKREQFNNKVKEKNLEEEMLVMRYDSRLDHSHSKKFLQRWEGRYVIFKKFKNGSYWLQDLSEKIHKYFVNGWRPKEFFQCIQPLREERQVSFDA